MRRVLYITGTRADYGPARGTLHAIRNDSELELALLVTGMHLDPIHGETWREIAADGFAIAEKVNGRVVGDTTEAMAASIGLFLYGMSQAIARIKPDIVLVLGDRGEALAGAMAASFQNIVVVHLCGGTLSGSIDDSIRHAITKFSHFHLAPVEEAASRIVQMGEDPSTVQVVGLPGADIRPDVKFTREQICSEYNLPTERPYLLVIQHPVTHSRSDTLKEITETLEAVASSGYPALLANPNDDAGGRLILAEMRKYADRHASLRMLGPTRSREKFASIMANAGALVGNSSSGVAEAMSVRLPVVNIGDRQRGREGLACWITADHDRASIAKAIDVALHDDDYRRRLADFSSRANVIDTSAMIVDRLRSLNLKVAAQPKRFFSPDVK